MKDENEQKFENWLKQARREEEDVRRSGLLVAAIFFFFVWQNPIAVGHFAPLLMLLCLIGYFLQWLKHRK